MPCAMWNTRTLKEKKSDEVKSMDSKHGQLVVEVPNTRGVVQMGYNLIQGRHALLGCTYKTAN